MECRVLNRIEDPQLDWGVTAEPGYRLFDGVIGGSGDDDDEEYEPPSICVYRCGGFLAADMIVNGQLHEVALFNIPKGFALKQALKVVYRKYKHPSYTDVTAHDVAVYAYFENSSGKKLNSGDKMVAMAVVRVYELKELPDLEDNTHVDVFSVKFDTAGDKPFEFEPMSLERVRELHHGATYHWFQCNQKLVNPEGTAVRALTDMFAVGRLYGREYTAAVVADESEGKRVKSE